MNELKQIDEKGLDIVNDSTALIRVIERASLNPDVDIDKMERLLQMHERITARQAEMAYSAAMTRVQSKTRQVAANGKNNQTHSKYATYPDIDKMLRPIYTPEGFSLSFDTADSPKEEHIRVLCHVSHINGHTRTHHVDMPADGKGAKGGDVMTKTHAAGSGMQYGMRYLVKMIFNVAIGDDDNDGNDAVEYITKSQVADLLALIDEVKADKARLLAYLKIDRLESLPAKSYKTVVEMVEAKRKK